MKVIQLINSLSAGGAETFVTNLSEALTEFCEVRLITYAGAIDSKGDYLKQQLASANNIHLDAGAITYKQRLMVPFWLTRQILAFKPDIIHAHLPRMEQFAMLSSAMSTLDTTLVRTKHDSRPISRNMHFFSSKKMFSAHIACSPAALQELRSAGLWDNSHLILNGIRHREIQKGSSNIHDIRLNFGVSPDDLLALCIGRMEKTHHGFLKGHDVIINAMSRSDITPKLHLIFIGDGPARKEIEKLADSPSVKGRIHFAGVVADTAPYMKAADFMVLPSPSEGLPLSVIECACHELPLLLSKIPALEIFRSSSTMFCTPNSPEDFRRGFQSMIANIPLMKHEAKLNSKHYFEQFSIRNSAIEHHNLYKNLRDFRNI